MSIFASIVYFNILNISKYMNAEFAQQYLRMQTVSLLVSFINTLLILYLTIANQYKIVYQLTAIKILISIIFDYIFIKNFSELGASYSEIATNFVLIIILAILMKVNNILYFSKLENRFIKDWLKIGTFSGIQIFLDNFIYAVMVCKMVNAVSESGNYWIANNFIYGWLLVPVTCLCEIIKKNNYKKLTFQNTWKYMCIIFGFWIISSPFWSFFIKDVLKQDSKTILSILCILVPFYIFYTIAIFIDSYFISKGKTIYNTISSLIVNIVYYGIVYILFKLNIFQLNIKFIIFMFGFGMLVHCMLSIVLYKHEQKE